MTHKFGKKSTQDSLGHIPDFDGLPVAHVVGAPQGDNVDVEEADDDRGQRTRHQREVLDPRVPQLPESVVEAEEVEEVTLDGLHLFLILATPISTKSKTETPLTLESHHRELSALAWTVGLLLFGCVA